MVDLKLRNAAQKFLEENEKQPMNKIGDVVKGGNNGLS
jgi:hypothetical protein